jgi:hypothetical protein
VKGDLMKTEKGKLINAFAPTVPMWAVYYDVDSDELWTSPVVALGLIQPSEGNLFLQPMDFGRFVKINNILNLSDYFCGYSLTAHPIKADWKDEIGFVEGKCNKNKTLSKKMQEAVIDPKK